MVISIIGSSENFLDTEILKTTTIGPLQFNYAIFLLKALIRSNIDI